MKHHVVIDEKMENVLSTERTITTIDALLDKESNLELLNRVFDAFTDRERSIAQDYFVSEMTAEEVANRNQTSIGAIKAIVFLSLIHICAGQTGKAQRESAGGHSGQITCGQGCRLCALGDVI